MDYTGGTFIHTIACIAYRVTGAKFVHIIDPTSYLLNGITPCCCTFPGRRMKQSSNSQRS